MFRQLIFQIIQIKVLNNVEPDVRGSNESLLREEIRVFGSLPIVGHHAVGEIYGKIVSLPLTHFDMDFFFLFAHCLAVIQLV